MIGQTSRQYAQVDYFRIADKPLGIEIGRASARVNGSSQQMLLKRKRPVCLMPREVLRRSVIGF
jgi:hypothetical protein